ncbi:MAG: hypothetical protein RLY30_167 [Pseudomonadota bacterium]
MSDQQLILGLIEESPPPLDQVVHGPNAEAWSWLVRVGQGERPPGERLLLWGAPGSGKSAALKALSQQLKLQRVSHQFIQLRPPTEVPTEPAEGPLEGAPERGLDQPLLIDNLEHASPALQQALFARLVAQPSPALLVATTGRSLSELAALGIRDDLRTRLAQGLVYPLAPLSEPEQLRVLRQKAHALGWTAQIDDTQFDSIFLYMLKRMPRHLGWLCGLLQAVDQAALAQKRPVSVPLLRTVAEGFNAPAPS